MNFAHSVLHRAVHQLCDIVFQVEYDASVIVTTGGNRGGEPCVFPFIYKGREYDHCIGRNSRQLWCGTTSNYGRDKLWGECRGKTSDECLSISLYVD